MPYSKDDMLKRMDDIREEHQISARTLSLSLGMGQNAFTDWRNGRGVPSIETVCKFSNLFQVPVDYLLYGETRFSSKEIEACGVQERELLQIYSSLPGEYKKMVSSYAKGLLIGWDIEQGKQKA